MSIHLECKPTRSKSTKIDYKSEGNKVKYEKPKILTINKDKLNGYGCKNFMPRCDM